jgi:hypothetical protein
MINHKGSFYLGVFIFIIPFLGFPTMWKMVLVVLGGVLLILTSLKVPSPRKIQRPIFKMREETPETPIIEIKPLEVSKPVEPVVVHAPVVEVPIIKIDREIKKPRKPRAKTSKSESVKKLDIKQ